MYFKRRKQYTKEKVAGDTPVGEDYIYVNVEELFSFYGRVCYECVGSMGFGSNKSGPNGGLGFTVVTEKDLKKKYYRISPSQMPPGWQKAFEQFLKCHSQKVAS